MVIKFFWQEKQRAKTKEKIDKCVKEKLVDFCNVLDIPINKTAMKKVKVDLQHFSIVVLLQLFFIKKVVINVTFQEELSAKLFEFLVSPHATTDVLLADKEMVIFSTLFHKDKN